MNDNNHVMNLWNDKCNEDCRISTLTKALWIGEALKCIFFCLSRKQIFR